MKIDIKKLLAQQPQCCEIGFAELESCTEVEKSDLYEIMDTAKR